VRCRLFRLLIVLLMAGSTVALAESGPPTLSVEKVAVTTHTRHVEEGGTVARVNLAYFDAQGRLQWDDGRVSDAGSCNGGWFPQTGGWSPRCRRTTVTLAPRVDECRCTGTLPDGRGRTGIVFAGLDEAGDERWRRVRLSPLEGEAPMLAGAHGQGMVFSDLEVWSPATGATIRRGVRAEHFRSAHYLPMRDRFLGFQADVTLLRSRGGLYLYGSESGERELVLPVDDSLTGYYEIADLAVLPGERWVLLGERFSTRGPGRARFEIFDLESRRIIFSEAFEKGHYISGVRVTTGRAGNLAFSFLDETAGEYVVVHYRVGGAR